MRTMIVTIMVSAGLYAGAIEITNAYVREVPPTMTNSAAYMTLANETDRDVAVIDGASDASKVVELHTHDNVNGMMQMKRVPRIVIPAKGETQLKPGGLHLMLIGLKKPLKQGDNVAVSIQFDNNESVTINAPVKRVRRMMKHAVMRCGAGKCGAGKCGGSK